MKKKSEKSNLIILGIICLLPCLIIGISNYLILYLKYIRRKNTIRIIDIKNMRTPIIFACSIIFPINVICCYYVYELFFEKIISDNLIMNSHEIMIISITIFILISSIIIIGMNISVVYLGVVFNLDQKIIICPHDMQSYKILDYIILKFIFNYASVDIINIYDINKISRGYGKELYLHGKFGSRRIKMSSKQKRDECLSIIQNIIKQKGIMICEIESY